MKPLLIHARPINPATGLRVDVRLGSGATPAYNGLGGFVWEAAVTQRPRLMLDLMSPDLDGQIETGKGELAINVNKIQNLPQNVLAASLVWAGAPITIYDATAFDYAAMPVEFTGIVRNGQLDIFTGRLGLNLEVDISRLARPLLFHEFTGSGGNVHNADGGGDPEKRGVLKPAGFGVCKNIEPVWFDETNNVGMLDGYGNLTSVQGLFEGLDDRGASFGNYATYADLVAAAIPPGRWATCLAEGLVRLGAPPAGVITVDATFKAVDANIGLPGSLIYDILYLRAGIPAAEMDIASFNALSAAVPRLCHYWTATQRVILDLTQAIAASCNATLVVLLNGKIAVTRAFGGQIIGALNRDGTSQPPVTDWQVADAIAPVWRMRARAARPGRVLDYSEVNYEDDLDDKGSYKTGETYRQGHLVWAPNGAQFLYINATPAAGQALPVPPATDNAHWRQTREPTTAADLVYSDGTSIEALKPAALGADVTAANTAAAIDGQGAFATKNTAGYGSPLLTGFGGLAALGNVYFGSPYLLETAGGAQATINAFKTALGIASAIDGQGAFATVNSAGYGSPLLTGFGTLAARATVRVGFELVRQDGTTVATEVAVITPLGTAAAIDGQGALATLNAVDYASQVTGSGRPEQGANRGGNLVYNAALRMGAGGLEGHTPIGTPARQAPAAGDPGFYFRVTANGHGYYLGSGSGAANAIALPEGASKLFASCLFRGSHANSYARIYVQFYDAAGAALGGLVTLNLGAVWGGPGPATSWTVQAAKVDVPAGAASFYVMSQGFPNGGPTADVFGVRVATTELAATLGADINADVRDGSTGALLTRAQLLTILGIAAGFTGQAPIATDNDALARILAMRGDNLVRNADFGEGNVHFVFGSSAVYGALPAGAPTSNGIVMPAAAINPFARANSGAYVPFAGRKAWGSAYIRNDGAPAPFRFAAEILRADGTQAPLQYTDVTVGTSAVFNLISAPINIPADAAKVTFYVQRLNAAAATGAAYVTLVRFAATQAGGDVTAEAQVVVVPPPTQSFPADHLGAIAASQFPRAIASKVTRGGQDIRKSAGTSHAITTANVTATVDNVAGSDTKGQISITGVAAKSGTIDHVVTVDGVVQPAVRILVERNDAAPPATGAAGATSAQDSVLNNVSTTYAATSDVLTLRAPASGTIALSAPLTFERAATASGSTSAWGKWQWRAIGGTWADVAAEIASSQSAVTTVITGEPTEQSPGTLSVMQSKTGLTAGTDYEFQLLARSSNVVIMFVDGYARASQ